MNRKKIIAGIVTYNPDLDILEENMRRLSEQCGRIVIADNASQNISGILELTQNINGAWVFQNAENGGIAKALNQLVKIACEDNFDWILTMDQDSFILPGLIERYVRFEARSDVGMITCNVMERNAYGSDVIVEDDSYEFVDKCITSGCYTNTKAVKSLGGFDEGYFIDYVDFDMCIRMIQNGYQVLKLNYNGILHSTGNLKPLTILGRPFKTGAGPVNIYHESPERVYWFFRNTVFFWRKYKAEGISYTNPIHILWRAILIILFEKPKGRKIKMIVKGVIAGSRKELT